MFLGQYCLSRTSGLFGHLDCDIFTLSVNLEKYKLICGRILSVLEIIYTKDEQIVGVFFSFISNTLHICHKKPEHGGWAQRKTSYNPRMKNKSYHWVSPLSIIFVSKKGKIVPSEKKSNDQILPVDQRLLCFFAKIRVGSNWISSGSCGNIQEETLMTKNPYRQHIATTN